MRGLALFYPIMKHERGLYWGSDWKPRSWRAAVAEMSPSIAAAAPWKLYDRHYNLISDKCISVNGHHVSAGLCYNVIGSIAVRAVDETGQCRNISVSAEGCSASIDDTNIDAMYRVAGISVRKYPNRVRIAVPNCANINLVMWVICQNGTFFGLNESESFTVQMIKFVITRGFNLQERSHGIIGECGQAYYQCLWCQTWRLCTWGFGITADSIENIYCPFGKEVILCICKP